MICKVSPGQFCEHKRLNALVKPQHIHRVIFDQRLLLGQWLRSWKRRSANSSWSMRLNINVFSNYDETFSPLSSFFLPPSKYVQELKVRCSELSVRIQTDEVEFRAKVLFKIFVISFFWSQGHFSVSCSCWQTNSFVPKFVVLSVFCYCWETPMYFSLPRFLLFLLTN